MEEYFREWFDKKLDGKGWDRAELSRRSGINDSTLSAIYNGKRGAGPEIIQALSDVFDCSLEEIFRALGLRKKVSPDTELKEHLDHSWSELTPEEQEDVLSYIEFKKSRKLPITTLAQPAIQPRKKRQIKPSS